MIQVGSPRSLAMASMAACAGGAVSFAPRQGLDRDFYGLRATGAAIGSQSVRLATTVGPAPRLKVQAVVRDAEIAPSMAKPGQATTRIGSISGVGDAGSAPGAAKLPVKQKIRIKLRSYWVPLIEQACKQILEAATNTNSKTMGPVPLPTKRRLYCVLRSPHVDKDSREHFEIRTHRRLIDLENPNAQTIDALMQLDLPAGVDVEVKLST